MITPYTLSQITEHNISNDFINNTIPLLAGIVRNEVVLIKPNIVYPLNPFACTNSLFLLNLCKLVLKSGAKQLIVGDTIPAWSMSLLGSSNIFDAYEMLGYNAIKHELGEKVTFVDLWEDLPHKYISLKEGLRIRIISKPNIIISCSLPKIHSESVFSGCTKNLMGLIHPNDVALLHSINPTHAESRYQDILCMSEGERVAVKGIIEKLGLKAFDEINSLFSACSVSFNSYIDYVELLVNGRWSKILNHLSENKYLSQYLKELACLKSQQSFDLQKMISLFIEKLNNIFLCVGILDGTYILSHEQHAGKPVDAGFVTFSIDPMVADQIGIELLGIKPQNLKYINRLRFSLSPEFAFPYRKDFKKILYPIGIVNEKSFE